MRWHTAFERQKAAQERQALLAVEDDFDPAIGATDHGAQTQQQDFFQRIKHFGLLARVLQAGETLQELDWLIGTFGHLLVPPRTLQVWPGRQYRVRPFWVPHNIQSIALIYPQTRGNS